MPQNTTCHNVKFQQEWLEVKDHKSGPSGVSGRWQVCHWCRARHWSNGPGQLTEVYTVPVTWLSGSTAQHHSSNQCPSSPLYFGGQMSRQHLEMRFNHVQCLKGKNCNWYTVWRSVAVWNYIREVICLITSHFDIFGKLHDLNSGIRSVQVELHFWASGNLCKIEHSEVFMMCCSDIHSM